LPGIGSSLEHARQNPPSYERVAAKAASTDAKRRGEAGVPRGRPHRVSFYHRAVVPVASGLGLYRLLRAAQRETALILMYHGVMDTGGGQPLVNVNQVDLESFRWQLEFLRKHYSVVPLADIVWRIRRGKSIARLAAITFDDGYLSVYENAAPVLRSLDLPSIVFLIAGCVEHGRLAWYDRVEAHVLHAPVPALTLGGISYELGEDRSSAVRAVMRRLKAAGLKERDDLIAELAEKAGLLAPEHTASYRLMGWDQVRELKSQGMAFGVHTFTHPHLSKLDDGLRMEIDEAAALISKRLSMPVDELVFCYPDGDYNNAVRDHVASSGMCGAVAVVNALATPASDPFALPRVAVGREYSPTMFDDSTVGFTRWLKRCLGS
jgi:peptidoglycan/xylan/chitin deacetylase (PgdA/CDA1 family)